MNRNKRKNTRLETSKEEQKNNKMRTIKGTLSQLGTSKMNKEFNTCTKEKKNIKGNI